MRLRQRSKKAPSETLVSLEHAVEDLLAHIDFLESENKKLRRAVTTKEASETGLDDHEQVILRLQQVIRSKESAIEELQDAFREQRDELEQARKGRGKSNQTEHIRARLVALLDKINRLEKLIFAPHENSG